MWKGLLDPDRIRPSDDAWSSVLAVDVKVVRPSLIAWLKFGLARRHVRRVTAPYGSHEDVIREPVPGRSFLDVGAIWNVHGANAFVAEDAGASSVTAVDVVDATPEFERRREHSGSQMRFVRGDLHDPDIIRSVGVHDIVFCAGVIYHTPSPMHTLECLRAMCAKTLVVAGASIPEIPGVPQAAIFYPGLGADDQRAFNTAFDAARGRPGHRAGLSEEFQPEMGYDAW